MQAIPLTCSGFGRKMLRAAALSLALGAVALSGCGVYRHEVLQGNFISKEQAQALQPGMTRAQVRQIMGTPLITDMFRADRWDYVFTMRNRRGVEPQKFSVSVFFEGDALARVEGLDELPTNQDFVDLIGSKCIDVEIAHQQRRTAPDDAGIGDAQPDAFVWPFAKPQRGGEITHNHYLRGGSAAVRQVDAVAQLHQ